MPTEGNRSNQSKFDNLNFDLSPSTATLEVVNVQVHPEIILNEWSQVFWDDLRRRNIDRTTASGLTANDINYYFQGLVFYRVQSVLGSCKEWRVIKQLPIPCWIQEVISKLGEVIDQDRGYLFKPTCTFNVEANDDAKSTGKAQENSADGEKSAEAAMVADVTKTHGDGTQPFKKENSRPDVARMIAIGRILQSFQSDGVNLVFDAFPRTKYGDLDMMMTCVKADIVATMNKVSKPLSVIAAVFLGLTVDPTQHLDNHYRVSYGSTDYIRNCILLEQSLVGSTNG